MFKKFVVVRVMPVGRTDRPWKSISKFSAQSATAWVFEVTDLDFALGCWGFSQVFLREDAAGRYYNQYLELDGVGSTIYLLQTSALTGAGAAKSALSSLLYSPTSTADQIRSHTCTTERTP